MHNDDFPTNPLTPEEDAHYLASLDAMDAEPFFVVDLAGPPIDLDALNGLAGLPPQPPAPSPTVAPPTPFGPSVHISIRIPTDRLDAIKREAARTGMPYQTLINQVLALASSTW